MAKPEPSRRAPHEALTLPIEQIRWRGDRPRSRTPWRTYTALVTTGAFVVGVGAMGASAGPETPRLAPPGCIFHTVVKNDTVWKIAGRAGITLDVAARLNGHIRDLSKIEIGDQIAISCGTNEVQRATLAPAVHVVNVDRWLGELEAPGVPSRRAVLAALYKVGARDQKLITLAAISDPESGRRLDAKGDTTITTSVWDYSAGVFQIRGLKAERGKGTTRDVQRAHTLLGGAQSASELWDQSVARGKPGGQPWTAFLLGHERGHIPTYTALATEMGLI